MIEGLPPFWDDNQVDMLEKIVNCDIDNVQFDRRLFSPDCKDFIKKVISFKTILL